MALGQQFRSKRPAGLLDPVKEPEAGVTPTPDAKPRKEDQWLAYAPTAFNEEWKRALDPMKIKVDIPAAEFTHEEMLLRIPDSNSAVEIGEEIMRRQQEEEQAKEAAEQEKVAKKAIEEYENAEKKAKADEEAAKEQREAAEKERQAAEIKLRETAHAVAAARTAASPGPPAVPGLRPSPQPSLVVGQPSQPQKPVAPSFIKPFYIGNHVPCYTATCKIKAKQVWRRGGTCRNRWRCS